MGNKRKAMVAGSFYDANRESLSQQLTNCFLHELGPQLLPEKDYKNKRRIMGVISPHAGFMFSGPISAHHFFRLSQEKAPQTIIILGPNHRGFGAEIAIMSSGQWETPLGSIDVDQQLVENMMMQDGKHLIKDDIQAHQFEHSIEVQLPFLQFIYPVGQFKIVPICITNQQLNTMKYLADVIYQSTKEKSCLLVASSDFTHYENQESARRKDTEAIEKIINMDSNLFYDTIRRNSTSICGPGPITVVIEVCKKLGISKGQLLKYATSGDVSGMNDQVVGYASIIFQ
jgi:MEMO1 family protein